MDKLMNDLKEKKCYAYKIDNDINIAVPYTEMSNVINYMKAIHNCEETYSFLYWEREEAKMKCYNKMINMIDNITVEHGKKIILLITNR